MKYKLHSWRPQAAMFFDVPDDGGGAPAPVEEPGITNAPAPSPQAQAGPSFDPKAIATELGNVLAPHFQQQQTAPRQPTPEEIAQLRKELKIWEPGDEWNTKFDNMETRKAALAELRDGLFAQNFEATRRFYEEREQRLMQQFAPVMTAFQKQQEEALMGEMATAVPALKSLRPIVDKVVAHFHMQGTKFNSKDELFKAVAAGVEQVMQVSNPQYKLPAGGTPATKPGAIPVTTSGSGGGGGRSTGGPNSNKPKAVQLLEG